MGDRGVIGAEAWVRSTDRSARRGARRGLVLFLVVSIALLMAVPVSLDAFAHGVATPHLGTPRATTPSISSTATRASDVATPFVAGGHPPAGLGAGPSAILATIDLVDGAAAPGADNRTFNGVGPTSAAYDPENQLLYVASTQGRTVQIVNTTTRQVVGEIPIVGTPVSIVYDPAGREVFVADYSSNNVSVINDLTNTLVGQIPIPSGVVGVQSGPSSLVYDSLNHTVLVGQYGSSGCCTDNITVVNGVSNEVVGELPAPEDVIGLAYNPNSELVYALGEVDPGIGNTAPEVGIWDLTTGASAGNWTPLVPLGYYTGIAVDPQAGLVYLASSGLDAFANLTEISAANGHVVHNTTLREPGTSFDVVSAVYSNSTGKIYFSGETEELFTITAASDALVGGIVDGSCIERVALTASGAPFVVPDSCADALIWLDGKTALVTQTSNVGADPVAVEQLPGTGTIAVVESSTQRLDLVDPTSLAVTQQLPLSPTYGHAPAATTTDSQTGWLYYYDTGNGGSTTTGPVVAFDTSGDAVRWTYTPCSGCAFDGLGDSNGWIFVVVINSTADATQLLELNATTGAVEGNLFVASNGSFLYTSLPQTEVDFVANTSVAVLADLALEAVIALNISSAVTVWNDASGPATGPLAYLPQSNLVAFATGTPGAYAVEFANATTGTVVRIVPIPNQPTSIAPGGTGTDAYVLEQGYLLRVSTLVDPVNISVPAAAGLTGVFYLNGSGGIGVPSENFGAVYWLGAALNITGFAAVGPTVQGETLTLQANVTGGYGADTFVYSGLPPGCVAANAASVTCDPLSSGPAVVTVRANDSTGLPATSAKADLLLAEYPLVVNLSSATTFFLVGTSATFAAQLPANESGISPFLNYSWALDPATAGTLNRSNASTVTVVWDRTGSVTLVLSTDFRGTAASVQLKLSVLTSSTSSSFLGLTGTETLLLIGLVVIVVAAVAAALFLRSRRDSPSPAPEPAPETEEPPVPEPEPAAETPPPET